jgi:hypothetical protein
MNRKQLFAAALLAVGMIASASAQTTSFTVDCTRGQSIADAITRADARKPLLVIVRGTCNESVTISREDVTLRGHPSVGGAVAGAVGSNTIVIFANRVSIEDLTVIGGNIGILLQGPFFADIRDTTVQSTSGAGIVVRAGDIAISGTTVEGAGGRGVILQRGASARITFSHLHGNTSQGIYAETNSTLILIGSRILANGSHGIQLESGSQGSISGSQIAENETGVFVNASQASIGSNNIISSNRQRGVLAQAGAKVGLSANTIALNQQDGVVGYLGATLVLHGNEISDNFGTGVACDVNCTLQIGGAGITRNEVHGILVMRDSLLILEEPMTDASGNYGWVDLWCGDKESSVGGLENFIGTVSDSCTGFDD